VCSLTAIRNLLLPHFLARHPGHELGALPVGDAAKRVRGRAEAGDVMCREIFQVQAQALGMFFDQMVNVFDPDALIVGGGAIEASADFQRWFVAQIRAGMPTQRAEQADIPIHLMPNGDSAGARGAALDALTFARAATFAR
jgi:predicted NBD/HSP70 family sugar kinase